MPFDGSPLNVEILCSAESENNVIVPQGITRQRTESAKEPLINENARFTTALAVWPNLNMKKIEDKLQQPLEHWNLLRESNTEGTANTTRVGQ